MGRRSSTKLLSLETPAQAYFLAMLRYRRNPADPKALVVLHTISSGPSQVDGRWENRGLPGLHHSVQRDLEVIASRLWLLDRDVDLLVADTHVCTWEECRRYGDGTSIIRYCSTGCRIRHEYDLWMRCMNRLVEYAVSRM